MSKKKRAAELQSARNWAYRKKAKADELRVTLASLEDADVKIPWVHLQRLAPLAGVSVKRTKERKTEHIRADIVEAMKTGNAKIEPCTELTAGGE